MIKRVNLRNSVVIAALCLPCLYIYKEATQPVRFKFAVLGDQDYGSAANVPPYNVIAQDARQTYLLTIEQVNKANVDFTVHVGDMQLPRYGNCSEKNYRERLALMNSFIQPLIFTPADNDWSDFAGEPECPNNPLENLALLRSLFYPTENSLGAYPRPVERQPHYPENQRWYHKGIMFATFHTLGPDDMIHGGTLTKGEQQAEYQARQKTNIDWIRQTFVKAQEHNAQAVVLFTHADRWQTYFTGQKDIFGRKNIVKPTFEKLMQVIYEETKRFAEERIKLSAYFWSVAKKHVYLFYGDSHTFTAFRPLLESFNLPKLQRYHVPYYMEIQVPGPSQGWVEVDIDFSNSQPLGLRVHGFAS